MRPAFTIGNYLYYELNIDYIIENYCINTDKPELNCDGKCYLAQQLQLQKQELQKDSHKEAIVLLAQSFIPLYYTNYQYSSQFYSIEVYSKISTNYINHYITGLQEIILPPPEYYFS